MVHPRVNQRQSYRPNYWLRTSICSRLVDRDEPDSVLRGVLSISDPSRSNEREAIDTVVQRRNPVPTSLSAEELFVNPRPSSGVSLDLKEHVEVRAESDELPS